MLRNLTFAPLGRLWPHLWQRSTPRLEWLAPLRALDERVFFPYRFARLTELLTPHLQDVANVLDVGASCGRLARRLPDGRDRLPYRRD